MRLRGLGARALSIITFLAAGAALAVTLAMNWHLGRSFAHSDVGQILQGAASLINDVFAATLALAVGVLWVARRRVLASAIAMAALAFGVYSMVSVAGFGAAERIAKARATSNIIKESVDAARRASETEIALRAEQLEWMREQYKAARKGDKAALMAAISAETSKPIPQALTAAPVPAFSDAQSEVLAELSGFRADHIQVGFTILVGVLLVSAKLIGFGLVPVLWSAGRENPVVNTVAASVPIDLAPSDPPPSVSAPAPDLVAPAPDMLRLPANDIGPAVTERTAPPAAAAPQSVTDTAADVVSQIASAISPEAEEEAANQAHVAEFVCERMVRLSGHSMLGSDAYRAYADWSESRGSKALSRSRFARALSASVQRKGSSLVGVTLREEVSLAPAA